MVFIQDQNLSCGTTNWRLG